MLQQSEDAGLGGAFRGAVHASLDQNLAQIWPRMGWIWATFFRKSLFEREPVVRIEPTTCSLRMSCSTTELHWPLSYEDERLKPPRWNQINALVSSVFQFQA